MSVMRAALLSVTMISAIVLSGAGIYTASVSGHFGAVDGYGVNTPR